MDGDRDRVAMPNEDLVSKVRAAMAERGYLDDRQDPVGQYGRRCAAIANSGAPCQAYALGDSEYCYWHDPSKADERTAARRKGARVAAKLRAMDGITIASVADWLSVLVDVANDVLRTEMRASNRARCICLIAKTYAELATATDLESRVAALEAKADAN